jgi:hypothetical protein
MFKKKVIILEMVSYTTLPFDVLQSDQEDVVPDAHAAAGNHLDRPARGVLFYCSEQNRSEKNREEKRREEKNKTHRMIR